MAQSAGCEPISCIVIDAMTVNVGCDSFGFLYLHTQNICKTNEFKSVYISQDSIGPVLYGHFGCQMFLFFSSHCSLLELNAKLRILSTTDLE